MEMPHSIIEMGELLCECQMVVRTLGCPCHQFVKYACCWMSLWTLWMKRLLFVPYEECHICVKMHISTQKISCVCLAPVKISEVQPFTNVSLLCKSLHFLGSCSACQPLLWALLGALEIGGSKVTAIWISYSDVKWNTLHPRGDNLKSPNSKW